MNNKIKPDVVVQDDVVVKNVVRKSSAVPATTPSFASDRYMYFTERDLNKILTNLDALRSSVFPLVNPDNEIESRKQQNFPSVCLIGLGRCGSNIALDVASLVYNARNFYLNEFNNEEKQTREQEYRPMRWIKRSLHLSNEQTIKPVFLIEPLVMLGDLDKDIEGRIRFSHKGERSGFLKDYTKMKIMDLSEVHAGGSGNAPILGQYLAKIILNKDTQRFSNPDWKFVHSYLIDSCGIKANQSRLYFYIFSAGGGTGSGMASEFGLAQQYAYMSKTFDTRMLGEDEENRGHSFVFEPIFTSGICILPNISDHGVEMSEALHINAGRLLCKYLAEEWDFSYNFDNEDSSESSVMHRIRPWNAMMLISNDIMRYAEETDDGGIQHIDVNAMEKYANQYISQQIFNILTAQAVTTDYDENYFRRAGIDIGETIRLDANDLFMSLAGPVAVAYAESVIPGDSSNAERLKLFEKTGTGLNKDVLTLMALVHNIGAMPVLTEAERNEDLLGDARFLRHLANELSAQISARILYAWGFAELFVQASINWRTAKPEQPGPGYTDFIRLAVISQGEYANAALQQRLLQYYLQCGVIPQADFMQHPDIQAVYQDVRAIFS